LIYFLCNLIYSLSVVTEGDEAPPKGFRVLGAIIACVIWLQSLYFLSMIDSFYPLIFIIFRVFGDIIYFLVILLIILFAFANGLYAIGRNIIQFDKVAEDELPLHAQGITGALRTMYYISLGEVGIYQEFGSGEGTNEGIERVFLLLSTFIVLVHMMNMLIAIMGTTFERNREVEVQLITKGKLKFVVDNWWTKPFTEK